MTADKAARSGSIVGYARVSTDKQDEARQKTMLFEQGNVSKHSLYVDHAVSGAKVSRPEFDRMLANLDEGDIVVVAELDRLGRNSGHVISTMQELRERGIYVRSIADGVDSSTDMGEAMLSFLAIFAQMERRFMQRRTRSGLAEAKAQGRVGGRPRALDNSSAELAVRLSDEGKKITEIAKTLKVSQATVYRYIAAAK